MQRGTANILLAPLMYEYRCSPNDDTVVHHARLAKLLSHTNICLPLNALSQVSESRLSDLKKEITQLEEELEQTRFVVLVTSKIDRT